MTHAPLKQPEHGEWEQVALNQLHKHDVVLGTDKEDWDVVAIPGDGSVLLSRPGQPRTTTRRPQFLRRLDA